MGITNFPDGISAEGNTLKMGVRTVVDATLVVATGLTTVKGAVVSLNEDPGAVAGDVYQVSVTFAGGNLTIAIWQTTGAVATEDTSVSWIAWGDE